MTRRAPNSPPMAPPSPACRRHRIRASGLSSPGSLARATAATTKTTRRPSSSSAAPEPTQVAAAQAPAAPADGDAGRATTGSIPDRCQRRCRAGGRANRRQSTCPAAATSRRSRRRGRRAFAARAANVPADRASNARGSARQRKSRLSSRTPKRLRLIFPASSPRARTTAARERDFRAMYGVPALVLAYAPVAQMEGLRRAAHHPEAAGAHAGASTVTIVPARLDGSNFGSLTSGTECRGACERDGLRANGDRVAKRRAGRKQRLCLPSPRRIISSASSAHPRRFLHIGLQWHRLAALRQDDAAIALGDKSSGE